MQVLPPWARRGKEQYCCDDCRHDAMLAAAGDASQVIQNGPGKGGAGGADPNLPGAVIGGILGAGRTAADIAAAAQETERVRLREDGATRRAQIEAQAQLERQQWDRANPRPANDYMVVGSPPAPPRVESISYGLQSTIPPRADSASSTSNMSPAAKVGTGLALAGVGYIIWKKVIARRGRR